MEVVLRVRELRHLTSLPLQVSDLQLQLRDEPLCPLLCCRLLPLDRVQKLCLTSLQGAEQDGVDLQGFINVPL